MLKLEDRDRDSFERGLAEEKGLPGERRPWLLVPPLSLSSCRLMADRQWGRSAALRLPRDALGPVEPLKPPQSSDLLDEVLAVRMSGNPKAGT